MGYEHGRAILRSLYLLAIENPCIILSRGVMLSLLDVRDSVIIAVLWDGLETSEIDS